MEGAGDGEKRYNWRLGSVGASVFMGVSKVEIARPLVGMWSSTSSGDGRRLLTSGAHFVARECHFSLGSPSRKLLSAQRGCGFPVRRDGQQRARRH